MVQYPRHVRRNHAPWIALITFGVSFVAHAQAGGNVAGTGAEGGTTKVPWRGSSMSYGHSLSAMTFAPDGDPFPSAYDAGGRQIYQYNPTWAQNLVLLPEWHFNDLFFARGRLFISQEFTYGDATNSRHEVELSDSLIDIGTTGYKEKYSGIRISGNVRVGLPTSKLSQARTQYLSVGPAAILSRTFPVLSGLTLVYLGRVTGRFTSSNGIQTNQPRTVDSSGAQLEGVSCRDPLTANDCMTGIRSPYLDFSHGASISFQPHETVSVDATMLWTRQWLPTLTSSGIGSRAEDEQLANDVKVRDSTWFVLSASWQFSQPVGVALTAFTVSPQLGASGTYTFPIFNRNTVLYLDLILNIEAITSRIFTSSKS